MLMSDVRIGSIDCPLCRTVSAFDFYYSSNPIYHEKGECFECGFEYYTKFSRMSLEELNKRRKWWNELAKGDDWKILEPLQSLPFPEVQPLEPYNSE